MDEDRCEFCGRDKSEGDAPESMSTYEWHGYGYCEEQR